MILIITLLGLTMLVGLVFYVYNVGHQVNKRLAMQQAADATAISGAAWMARSMNVVAMNNVSQTRMLAMVAVLDSLPLAAEMTIAEQTDADPGNPDSLVEPLRKQLDVYGVPNSAVERDDFLRKGLEHLRTQMSPAQGNNGRTQYDDLESLLDGFCSDDQRNPRPNTYNVKNATWWSLGTTGPDGQLWQAARALDELSQASKDSSGTLAQSNAIRFGKANQAEGAFLAPITPLMPAKRGDFMDFRSPLTDSIKITSDPRDKDYPSAYKASNLVPRLSAAVGQPPPRTVLDVIERIDISGGAIPDYKYHWRLGPFCRLFGWRDYYQAWTSFGSNFGPYQRTNPGGQAEGKWGFHTYGPIQWAHRYVLGSLGQAGVQLGSADTSRFAHHLKRITNLKLAYMFGLPSHQSIQYADKWAVDYDKAKQQWQKAQKDPDPTKHFPFLRTRYYRPGVRSTVKWDKPDWLANGTTYASGLMKPISNSNLAALWAWEPRGWWDIEDHFAIRRWQPVTTNGFRRESVDLDGNGLLDYSKETYNYNYDSDIKKFGQPYDDLIVETWFEKVNKYIWRVKVQYTYLTYVIGQQKDANGKTTDIVWEGDPQLGLTPRYNQGRPDPNPTKVYVAEWYVYGGAEIRDPVEVTNPCNWGASEALPAPMLLDTGMGEYAPDHETEPRHKAFNFLGLARSNANPPLWKGQFYTANPTGQMVTVAQAQIFNNRSWDLWTQDWQASLVPVSQWENWRDSINMGGGNAASPLLQPSDVTNIHEYMTHIDPKWADKYLNH